MAPKLIAAVLTFLINIAAGVVIFFIMLVAMNGFSGSDASSQQPVQSCSRSRYL